MMTTDIAASTDCAICLSPIGETDLQVCPNCQRTYHRSCWDAQGGCQVGDCAETVMDSTQSNTEQVELPPLTSVPAAPNEALPWIIGGLVIFCLIIAAVIAVHLGASLNAVLVIGVVIAALAFDYVNGMHDAGNAIATVISTRVLTPAAALTM
ncbi:MAG TPA: RING finger protein, partial [Armatimonadota bacterium]